MHISFLLKYELALGISTQHCLLHAQYVGYGQNAFGDVPLCWYSILLYVGLVQIGIFYVFYNVAGLQIQSRRVCFCYNLSVHLDVGQRSGACLFCLVITTDARLIYFQSLAYSKILRNFIFFFTRELESQFYLTLTAYKQ